jgi:tetratricopeptide (TPR) repeat protein
LVAGNPEREQVLYSIFSPENLITFDEVWSVIEGFGNEYFIDIYKKRLQTDRRPRVKKYFRYFLGKLYLAEGNESEAIKYFEQVINDPDREDPFQTMLMARVYEGLATATGGEQQQRNIQQLYVLYPQLLPFTDLSMSFNLKVEGQTNEEQESILDELRDSNIKFVSTPDVPSVKLSFIQSGQALDAHYLVQSSGQPIQQGVLRIEEGELKGAGKLLAYRLFGIQKSRIGEKILAVPEPKKEVADKPV